MRGQYRGKNDIYNSVSSGFLAGGILARNAGPKAAFGGGLAFAAFSAAIDMFLRREPAEYVKILAFVCILCLWFYQRGLNSIRRELDYPRLNYSCLYSICILVLHHLSTTVRLREYDAVISINYSPCVDLLNNENYH